MSSSRFELVCSDFVILLTIFLSITHSAFFRCTIRIRIRIFMAMEFVSFKHFVVFSLFTTLFRHLQTQEINQVICDINIYRFFRFFSRYGIRFQSKNNTKHENCGNGEEEDERKMDNCPYFFLQPFIHSFLSKVV